MQVASQGDETMHDLLIALAFIGMVFAPAVVAARTTPEAEDSEPFKQ